MKLQFINALVIEQNGNKVIKENKAFFVVCPTEHSKT